MINNIQITGDPDTHPEKPVYDARSLALGQVDMTTLNILAHRVATFDLLNKEDVARYENLYKQLLDLAKSGKILISTNIREKMVLADGSNTWMRLLEWTEFDTSEIIGA